MFRSMIIAFSTYSKIPMPRVAWDEKSMRYSLCFFPVVGMVIGLLSTVCLYGLQKIGVGKTAIAAILTVLPILCNGGIHMDGFLDTMDARSSYKSQKEKLKILKDPHMGAFAAIYGCVYFLLYFGLFHEITIHEIGYVAAGYAYSRMISGWSIVTLKKAKKDGMVAAAADAAQKNVKWILTVEWVIWTIGMVYFDWKKGMICVIAGILSFVHYRHMAYQTFGGITGDLAGYFLQICELAILFGMVIVQYI